MFSAFYRLAFFDEEAIFLIHESIFPPNFNEVLAKFEIHNYQHDHISTARVHIIYKHNLDDVCITISNIKYNYQN